MSVLGVLVNFAIDIGKDALSDKSKSILADLADTKKLRHELEKFISTQREFHDLASYENEFDIDRLIGYLSTDLRSDCEKYLRTISPSEKQTIENDIIEKACDHSAPGNPEAKKKVDHIVRECLNIIENFYRSKIPPEQIIQNADIVSAIRDCIDEKQTAHHSESDTTTDFVNRCFRNNARYVHDKINPHLIPYLRHGDCDYRSETGLADILKDIWTGDGRSEVISVIADGGMGKSTLLKYAATETLAHDVVIYVPLEAIDSENISIHQYIRRVLFGSVNSDNDIYEIADAGIGQPGLVVLLDGLNEVSSEISEEYLTEIRSLVQYPGMQIVITSREDFASRLGIQSYRVTISALSEDQICAVLGKAEWEELSEALKSLLTNPMMLLMYMRICPLMEKHRESFLDWKYDIADSTDLIHDYYVSQIAVLLDHISISGKKIAQTYRILRWILPYIGCKLYYDIQMSVSSDEFDTLIEDALSKYRQIEDNNTRRICIIYRIRQIPEITAFDVRDYLLNEAGLMHQTDDLITFPHQIFRDYLAARLIIEESCQADSRKSSGDIDRLWGDRLISTEVADNIRLMSGEYWKDGLASTIAQYARNRQDIEIFISNLTTVFTYTAGSGLPDFSGLDLRQIRLADYGLWDENSKERIPLNAAIIDRNTLSLFKAGLSLYRCFEFSSNGRWLAGKSEKSTIIWSLVVNGMAFCTTDKYSTGTFEFIDDDRYLVFVPVGVEDPDGFEVYEFDEISGHWGGAVSDNASVRQWYENIFSKDNRFRKRRFPFKKNDPDHIVSSGRSKDGHLEAVCYDDGRLIVRKDGLQKGVLAKGVRLLVAASVSGDGKNAVTIVKGLYGNRLQFWNLTDHVRVRDVVCDNDIDDIHISDSGKWIICEKKDLCHVMTQDDSIEPYDIAGQPVSNQSGRLSFYGDKIFFRSSGGSIGTYDLQSRQFTPFSDNIGNISIVVFSPEGDIVIADKNSFDLKIRSIRSGAWMDINREHSPVSGCFFMRNKPFVVVATDNGKISVYHTGTGQRTRIFSAAVGNKIMVGHPSEDLFAVGDGGRKFGIYHLDTYPYKIHGRTASQWKTHTCAYHLNGNVLDMNFNSENHELVVITANGEILYCDDHSCKVHRHTGIITDFPVDQYDFRGVKCDEECREILQENGTEIS